MNKAFLSSTYDMLYLTICGVNGELPDFERLCAMNWGEVYAVSFSHNLTAITCMAVEACLNAKHPALSQEQENAYAKWCEAKDKALRKNILLDVDREALLEFLEESGIWYLPLKGILMKEMYPKSGMRQMSDNDILFDASFADTVRKWFEDNGYTMNAESGFTHDAYYKEPIYNFEMHKRLFEGLANSAVNEYYRDITSRLVRDEGKSFARHLTDEDLYVYLTTHEKKHFSCGGTGLRSLLDRYVFLKKKGETLDRRYVERELEMLGITQFERKAKALAERVFSSASEFDRDKLTDDEREMLEYYLLSGTYGTQRMSVRNAINAVGGSRFRFLLGKFFPKRRFMLIWCETQAPFFCRHKRLLFLAPAYRAVYGLTHHAKKSFDILKYCFIK